MGPGTPGDGDVYEGAWIVIMASFGTRHGQHGAVQVWGPQAQGIHCLPLSFAVNLKLP
jgi:hypothetical protein